MDENTKKQDERFTLTMKALTLKDTTFTFQEAFTVKFGTPYVETRDKMMFTEDDEGENVTLEDTLTLQRIELQKGVGKHNRLVMDFQYVVENVRGVGDEDEEVCSPYTFTSISDKYMRLFVDLEQRESEDSEENTGFVTAKNYIVTDVKPKYISRSEDGDVVSFTYNMQLTAQSWDVLADMTKYSRAYTAKRLGEDIFKGMMESMDFKSVAEEIQKNENAQSAVKLPEWSADGMRMLRASRTLKNETDEFEMRLPYLVQYNETDYEFLLRTANRFGEFLYFEYGQLHLGLSRYFEAVQSDGLDEEEEEWEEEEEEVDPPKEVVKEVKRGDTASIELISSADSSGASDVSFHKSTDYKPEGEKSQKPYVADFANDDYFDIIKKGAFDNKDAWMDINPELTYRMLSIFFQYQNLGTMAVDMALSEGILNGQMKDFANKANDKFDDKYFNGKYDANNSQYEKKNDEYRYAQFADLFGSDSSDSYKIAEKDRPDSVKIWSIMEEVRRRALTRYRIRFDGCQKDLQLGDIVKVYDIDKSARFVVVGVETVADESTVNFMNVIVIPETRKVTDDKSTGKFKPYEIPVPLPADVDMTREVGAQAAVVTDATDPKHFGRVRVRYHWQKDETDATPWIRVAVPFSTDEDSGFSSQLNQGDEVMVDYENGNIERPYVVGSLYNSANTTPFGQRYYTQIFRSRNGHTIGVREPTNSMNILSSFLPGLKMFSYIPGFNYTSKLDESENRKVQRAMGGFDICDTYGMYSISTSSDQRKISISAPFGTVNMDAAMGITISAPNGNVRIVGKNVDIVAGNNLTLKSGTNIDNAFLSSFARGKNGIVGVLGNEASALVDVGASLFDIPALRFAIELVFKPVSGTLKIHSGRYLMLEAGGNSANMPSTANKYVAESSESSDFEKRAALIKEIVKDCIAFKQYLRNYKNGLTRDFGMVCSKRAQVCNKFNIVKDVHKESAGLDNVLQEFVFKDNPTAINEDNLKNFIFAADKLDKATVASFLNSFPFVLSEFKRLVDNFKNETYKPNVPAVEERVNNLPKGASLTADYNVFVTEADKMNKYKDNQADDAIKKFNCGNDAADSIVFADAQKCPSDIYKSWMKAYLEQNLDALDMKKSVDLNNNNLNNWTEYLNGIEEKTHFWSSLGMGFLKQVRDNLVPWDFWNIYTWDANSNGRILMSQEKNETISFDGRTVNAEGCGMKYLRDVLNDTVI